MPAQVPHATNLNLEHGRGRRRQVVAVRTPGRLFAELSDEGGARAPPNRRPGGRGGDHAVGRQQLPPVEALPPAERLRRHQQRLRGDELILPADDLPPGHVRLRDVIRQPRVTLHRVEPAEGVEVPRPLSGHGPEMKVQTGRLLVVAVPVPRGDYRLSVGDGDVDRGWCAVVGPDDMRHRREHRLLDPRRVQQRVMVGELVQDEVEEKFRVRGPAHVLKQVVPEEREKPAPDLLEVCDVSVVHEHVPSVVERVAVVLVDARAGTRRADVPEQERGADVLGERAEVAVVRRRGDGGVHRRAAVRVQTVTIYQPAAIAGVPTHPAPVHVDRMVTPVVALAARGVPGPFRHVRQSVGRAVEELAEANLLPVVKDPATHLATPLAARGPCSRCSARAAPWSGCREYKRYLGESPEA